MQQSNIDKLNQYRPKLLVWQNDKTCHLSGDEKMEILNIVKAEFNPGYTVDLFCGICVVGMLEYAFRELDKRIETITIELPAPPVLYKKKK